MIDRILLRLNPLFISIMLLTIGASTGNAEDLAETISKQSGDLEISLTEDSSAANVFILDRTVSITSSGDTGHIIRSTSSDPAFIVGAGGRLVLDQVTVQSTDPEGSPAEVAIVVQGGTLELSSCIVTTKRRYAIYINGGNLKVRDCTFYDAELGVTVTNGGQADIRTSEFTNVSSDAVWVTGTGSKLELADTLVSWTTRGLSATEGAELVAEGVEVFNATEAAVYVDGATLQLSNFHFEGVEAFGLYSTNRANVRLENGSITGPISTGMALYDVNGATLNAIEMTDARTGVNLTNESDTVELNNLNFATDNSDAAHIVAAGKKLNVSNSTFKGGAVGIRYISGGLNVEGSTFFNHHTAALWADDREEDGSVATVTNSRFAIPQEAYGIYAGRGLVLRGNTIAYQGAAFGGPGFSRSAIYANRLVGFEAQLRDTSGDPGVLNLANLTIADDAAQLLAADVLAADAPSTADAEFKRIEQLLPLPDDVGAMARIASLAVEMEEAFLPAPWLPLAEVSRKAADGTLRNLGIVTSADLPLNVLPGVYVLDGQNGPEKVDLTEAGAEYWLEYTRANGPYGIYQDEAFQFAGETFELRPQNELRDILARVWPAHESAGRIPVSRPGVDIKTKNDALVSARLDLSVATQYLAGLPVGVAFGQLEADLQNRVRHYQGNPTWLPLGVLRTVGTSDDAKMLIETGLSHLGNGGDNIARQMIETGVEIDLRLGVLGSGHAAQIFAQLEATRDSSKFPPLAIALAKMGYRPALNALVDAIAVRRELSGWADSDLEQGFALISSFRAPAVLELSLELVDAIGLWVRNDFAGREKADRYNNIPIGSVFAKAYIHAAAYAQDADRARLNIAFPPWAELLELSVVVSNPEQILDHVLGVKSGKLYGVSNYKLISSMCQVFSGRTIGQQNELRDAVYQTLATYAERAMPDVRRPQALAADLISIGLSWCRSDPGVLEYLKRPENNDFYLFPTPMQYVFQTAEKTMSYLVDLPNESPQATIMDNTPPDWRATALQPKNGAAISPGIARYKSYANVATVAHAVTSDPYVGQTDSKLFLEPVKNIESGSDLFWISSKVNLSPVLANGRVLFGLGLETSGVSHQDFAAAIGRHYDTINRNTANFGRDMVHKMVLRHGSSSTELSFLQTTNAGVHVFEMTEPVSSNANLVIDVYFATKRYDDLPLRDWIVSFPLYRSPFGFSETFKHGQLELK